MSVRSAQWSVTSRIAVGLACFGSVVALAQDRTSSSPAVSLTFEKQILPILEARCARCHSGASPQAGLDIRTRTRLLSGGTTGPAIVSGSAERSLLYQRVRSGQMPLGGPPLAVAELELIRNWIERGAPGSPSGPDSIEPIVATKPAKHWPEFNPIRPKLPNPKNPPSTR